MILLDTHVLLWLALEPGKLSEAASTAIDSARRNDVLAVAGITLWELAWVVKNGRVQTHLSVEAFVRECVTKVRVIPETPAIVAKAVEFPATYPRDPQDRLIGATAVIEGVPLVTYDKLIRKSRIVPVIW